MGEAYIIFQACLKYFVLNQTMSSRKELKAKQWRQKQGQKTDKELVEQKAKNQYKKLLRKSEFKDFKSEVLGNDKNVAHKGGKQNSILRAKEEREQEAKTKAAEMLKQQQELEAKKKALEEYHLKKKKNFKNLSKRTSKGQPHMGSQMEVLLAKIQKQMQS